MILSLCSHFPANTGQVCKAIQDVTITFLLNPEEELKRELEEFNAPPEAVEADLRVKRCINQIMYGDRVSIGTSLVWSYCFTHSEGHNQS